MSCDFFFYQLYKIKCKKILTQYSKFKFPSFFLKVSPVLIYIFSLQKFSDSFHNGQQCKWQTIKN